MTCQDPKTITQAFNWCRCYGSDRSIDLALSRRPDIVLWAIRAKLERLRLDGTRNSKLDAEFPLTTYGHYQANAAYERQEAAGISVSVE